MRKKLNKDGLELLSAFDKYLKEEFSTTSLELLASIKQLLPLQHVDLSHFPVKLTYGKSAKVAAGSASGLLISLQELLAFHRTGRFREFDIRPRDHSRESLIATKENLPLTYTTNSGRRPKLGDITLWDGSFVLDIDIRKALLNKKLSEISEREHQEFAALLVEFRKALHLRLCHYHWYIWTTISSSMGGVHIRTKSSIELYVKCLESYFQQEKIEYTGDKLYELARDLNTICKYTVCFHEMLECLDIFNRYYDKKDSSWFEDAVDMSARSISQGMFVAYDSKLELNDNFKDVDLFVDVYELDFSQVDEWLYTNKGREFVSRVTRPFGGRSSSPAKVPKNRKSTLTGYDISNDSSLDVKLFRSLEDQLYDTHNELYWRAASYLYYQYAGKNQSRTIALCQQLFDPASKHSHIENIRARVASVAASEYTLERKFTSFMQLVVAGNINKEKIAAEQVNFEIIATPQNTYHLGPNEYVGDYIERVAAKVERGQSLVLVSGTGTGKTEGIMKLATQVETVVKGKDTIFEEEAFTHIISNGQRMLIIEPLKSIIKSKFKKYEHLIEFVYEDRQHKVEKNICVAIIDKVREQVNLGTVQDPNFDYIVIDESHLLTMSEYRKQCGLLLDFLRNKTIYAKIIYMTGTPVFERNFLPQDTVYVRFEKQKQFSKVVNIYPSYANPLVTMKRAMANEILNGRKVICILRQKSNMPGIIKDIKNYAEKTLGRKIRVGEFTADTPNSELAQNIIQRKCLGDIDLAFVTSVFSVGVDIENEDHVVLYTYQELNGVSVDQYANRLRHVDIEFNMYGRYLGGDLYRDLSSFTQPKKKKNNDAIFLEALKLGDNSNSLKMLLKSAQISYIDYDYAQGWHVNETLLQIHHSYASWEEWSKQYHVCAYYLRQLGYEVNILAKKVAGIELPTKREAAKEQTARRTGIYDRFMVIWNNYKDDIKGLYLNSGDTSILLQKGEQPLQLDEKRICATQEGSLAQQMVSTNELPAMSVLVNFMRVCSHYGMGFDFFVCAVEGTLIHTRNKQLYLNKLDMLTRRLWWQYFDDKALERVITSINELNDSPGPDRLSENAYSSFLDQLSFEFWGKEVDDPAQMRQAFESLLKLYYYIRRKKAEKGFVYLSPRHDDTFEKTCAAQKAQIKHKPVLSPQNRLVILKTLKHRSYTAEIQADMDILDFAAISS